MARQLKYFLMLIVFYSSTYAHETSLHYYRPYNKPQQLNISKKSQGHCPRHSYLIKRDDAWNCVVKDKLLDPCFSVGVSPKKVFCAQFPWSFEGVEIDLIEPLIIDNNFTLDMSKVYPWAIGLRDNLRCLKINSLQKHDNLNIRYLCSDNSVLIGNLQRCDPHWKVLHYHNKIITLKAVKDAWF